MPNAHLTRLSFWRRPDVRHFLAALDRDPSAGIFLARWGDAEIHGLALHLFSARVGELNDLVPFVYGKWGYTFPIGTRIWQDGWAELNPACARVDVEASEGVCVAVEKGGEAGTPAEPNGHVPLSGV